MDLRLYLKYNFAKTSRLKHVSIPYMQRILNSENPQFEKQEFKRKIKLHGDKNIEKKRKLY